MVGFVRPCDTLKTTNYCQHHIGMRNVFILTGTFSGECLYMVGTSPENLTFDDWREGGSLKLPKILNSNVIFAEKWNLVPLLDQCTLVYLNIRFLDFGALC